MILYSFCIDCNRGVAVPPSTICVPCQLPRQARAIALYGQSKPKKVAP